MATAEYRLYFDNNAAAAEQLAGFSEIRVDQAIGLATEAELHLDLSVGEDGTWSGMDESFAQPGARVRVEIKVGDAGEFIPLVDGPVIANRFELDAAPGQSTLIVVVQDDSTLLNLDEAVALYENQRADEIASQLFGEFGLQAEVDAVPDAGSALDRVVVQRGSAMTLLRDLARAHGMFIYVKPGTNPGQSVGVFKRPNWEPGALPQLVLLGERRNVSRFSAEFDALKPFTAAAYSVSASDKTALASELAAPDLATLGDEPVHDLVLPARTLLAQTREEQSDLDEAVTAAVNLSSFAYSARAEVSVDVYEGVLQPYGVVTVAGVGGSLSGDYLISRVTHVIRNDGYRQQFELKRNARSVGSGSGLPGGIV